MADESHHQADHLLPATGPEVMDALSFALRYSDGKRARNADALMARITAEQLFAHLERSGFVILRKPPAELHRTGSKTLQSQKSEEY